MTCDVEGACALVLAPEEMIAGLDGAADDEFQLFGIHETGEDCVPSWRRDGLRVPRRQLMIFVLDYGGQRVQTSNQLTSTSSPAS